MQLSASSAAFHFPRKYPMLPSRLLQPLAVQFWHIRCLIKGGSQQHFPLHTHWDHERTVSTWMQDGICCQPWAWQRKYTWDNTVGAAGMFWCHMVIVSTSSWRFSLEAPKATTEISILRKNGQRPWRGRQLPLMQVITFILEVFQRVWVHLWEDLECIT